jgi:nucleoside phosphorylase
MAGAPAGPGRIAPLLVVCALGVERAALRRAEHSAAVGPVALLRTGMGPHAAWHAVTEALRDPALRRAAVVATGFCAGLDPRLAPGDVVVDDRDPDGASLAAALTRRGATVHTGRIAAADHVVRGTQRAALRATGAVAVDMESDAIRRAALARGPRPVTAVRVVVDTPQYELLRVATLRTGIAAFRVLRSCVPAFLDWHRSTCSPGGEPDGHAAPTDRPGRNLSL